MQAQIRLRWRLRACEHPLRQPLGNSEREDKTEVVAAVYDFQSCGLDCLSEHLRCVAAVVTEIVVVRTPQEAERGHRNEDLAS